MQLTKEEPAMRFTQYLIRGIVFTISSPGDNGILIFEKYMCMCLLVTVYFRVDLIKRLLIFILNIYLKWTPQHLTGDSSTLIQVVAWCFYAPTHSPGQCLQSVYNENRTLRNKLQWNFNQNWYIFIQERAFENVVCKWWPFCLMNWYTRFRLYSYNCYVFPHTTAQ